MSRRERISQETAREIKAIARRLLAEKGAAGLSIRAIAREIEMTPPAIYTYFGSLDALITALIVDAFNAYADALATARDMAANDGQPLGEQLMAVTLAYREWAVAHPYQFQLIYGSPIPGYEAPAEVTRPAVLRIAHIFRGLMLALEEAGQLPPPDEDQPVPPGVLAHLRQFAGEDAPSAELYRLHDMYGTWVVLHGMVTLEVFNHLQGTVGDTAAFYEAQARQHYRRMGVE